MFPGALVHQLEQGMGDFLRTSFWSSTPGFDRLIEDFVTDRDAVFRGPYVSVNLPFRSGKSEGTGFENVPLKYRPHFHQELAFARLRARKNTIVATGTGSGKTECFAVPILAHCADRLSERGIKAIVLYPMNALAADQALRLAQLVYENPKLRGQLNIGMYVGDSEGNAHTVMGATHVITDRNTIRTNPPDILLTNYKMLDYLLMRPEDQVLWRDNGPETLSFLAVDELHTFDGAQGTDLACLIRRLKARLSTPKGYLCAVGTSATLGSDEDAVEALTRYASEVFAEPFDTSSVVGETRLTSTEFLAGTLISTDFDTPDDKAILSALNYPDETAFIDAQLRAWFGRIMSPEEALESLKQNVYFRNLLEVMATHPLPTLAIIADKLFAKNTSAEVRLHQTISLLSLASYARGKGQGLQVRLQFWQREMRRMVASVEERPKLAYHDDLTAKQQQNHLPVVFCRDCGLMGWGTIVDNQAPTHYACDIQTFYKAYFAFDTRVKFLFPHGLKLRGANTFWLNDGLRAQSNPPDTEHTMMPVEVPPSVQNARGKQKLSKQCPQCGEDGLSLLGFQAASLTSTFVSQLFTSKFNHDRRLLTFSDSVQDAAHRAGFFGARTWSFNLRVAILDVVKRHPDLTLAELRKQVPAEWRARLGDEAFVATFIPPNLEWRSDYEKLRESGELPKKSTLADLVERRFAWEITSEFTYKSLIGRTLRRTGAAATYVDQDRLTHAAQVFCSAMFESQKVDVSLEESKQILTGLTARMRDRGAVMTPDLPDEFLKTLGDNTFVFGRFGHQHLAKVGFYSRLPILLTDSIHAKFDHPFSNGSWYGRRVAQRLENKNVLLSSFAADAVRLALEALVDAQVVAVKQLEGARVWGLLPDAVRVTTHVTSLKTEKRHARMYFATPEANGLLGMPGMQVDDGDRYVSDEQTESFYANLYANGVVHRVNASEHTGLLKRKEREDIENSFKTADQRPWDINLLSCTPTLEMGIDIGALSSVILCSVPPNVANYVQRIGRAGRRDGNSLVLTIANANPHEMYFFAKPDEMIRGHVRPRAFS
ncbi:MAG: DEAD/DEAH box helicase [bacterium]